VNDRSRSIPPHALNPLRTACNAVFVSLQKSEQASVELPEIELADWTSDLEDFAETAALISHLDLIITVDTAVAHLAGALGKPVWMLLAWRSDWRWLHNRNDTPWYPTMRLFRQSAPDQWDQVVTQMSEILEHFCVS